MTLIMINRITNMNSEFGEAFEKQYVHTIYDMIAHQFDKTRIANWTFVAKFLDSINLIESDKTMICDVGCGNGKYMLYMKNKGFTNEQLHGCDMSDNLVKICKEKLLNVVHGDIMELPYDDNLFDQTICIAVLHHISTEERRIKAISELIRITKKGGYVLITVWAVDDLDEVNQKKRQFTNHGEKQDVMVPWNKFTTFMGDRYYHMFKKGELELLCNTLNALNTSNMLNIISSVYEKGNWNIILQKQ